MIMNVLDPYLLCMYTQEDKNYTLYNSINCTFADLTNAFVVVTIKIENVYKRKYHHCRDD